MKDTLASIAAVITVGVVVVVPTLVIAKVISTAATVVYIAVSEACKEAKINANLKKEIEERRIINFEAHRGAEEAE